VGILILTAGEVTLHKELSTSGMLSPQGGTKGTSGSWEGTVETGSGETGRGSDGFR